uniref:AAA+ ATPase domain-containing protein n=1 Tax=Acrobeloides nanus TaxID=290746 RepID=A0A914EGD3_9BILA
MNEHKFHYPFTAIVAGATGCGKSEWAIQLIENKEAVIDNPPTEVLYAYGEMSSAVRKLIDKDGIRIREGIPTREELKSLKRPTLLVLDDLMLNFTERKDNFLNELFTRGSHHWDLSVLLVTQDAFAPELRVARKNCHYLILMRAPQMQLAVRQLGQQLFPGQVREFMEAYKSATTGRFSYLVINNHPQTLIDSKFRLTT